MSSRDRMPVWSRYAAARSTASGCPPFGAAAICPARSSATPGIRRRSTLTASRRAMVSMSRTSPRALKPPRRVVINTCSGPAGQ